jgi:hypothetical protein
VKRWLLPLAPLPLLLALGAWASARVADRLAQLGVNALVVFAPLVRDTSPVEAEEPAAADIPTETALVPAALGGSPTPAPHGSKHGRAAKAPPRAPSVVFVTQEQVLRLASTRVRPHGAPVPANTTRPAGLKLSGVAALGIGLQDGDVLTRAVGQPALSSGAVIQAVLVARARRAPVLEGEFWRGAQRFLIRVEQPYLPERHAVETSTDAVEGPRLTLRDASPRFGTP